MKRNYGIDLLKFVSMYMVIVLHLIVNSGLLSENNILTVPGELTWLIWTFCFCAVLCFAIISGYVGFKTKHKISNIIYLWLIVELYAVIFGFIQMLIDSNLSIASIINLFFPVSSRQYWYFSEYILLFILMPALDAAVDNLSQNKCKFILIASIILITVYQNVVYGNDFLELSHDYCTLWLAILYCLGAYIKKYNPLKDYSNKRLLLLSILMPFISWGWQILCRLLFSGYEYMNVIQYFFYSRHTALISYLSITMVLQSFFMVLLFSRIDIKNRYKKLIDVISPLSFSVYIIHTTPLVFEYINNPLGKYIANKSFALKPLLFVAFAIIECVLCLLIDYLRSIIFNKLCIKKHILTIENRFISNDNNASNN